MSAAFTADQLAQFRTQLRDLAVRLQKTTHTLAADAGNPLGGEAGGGISSTPLHLADLGSATFDQEIDAATMENEEYLLGETVAAIDRLDAGTFGTCENCDRGILPERLDTLPYARYCTPCAAELKSGKAINLNTGRPGPRVNRAIAAGMDPHAAGEAGGGTAVGGLGGTNTGHGDPNNKIGAATGSGDFDAHNADRDDDIENDTSEDRRLN